MITITQDGNVVRVTPNRPEVRNAFNEEWIAEACQDMAMRNPLAAGVLAAALFALPACTTGRTGPAASRTQALLLDINTATRAELRRLPGITEAYATRIITHRPYKVKHELETRKILPASVYARIRDRVTAREP